MILLTSGDRPGELVRSRELRIDARLLKPLQQDELLETIYQVISEPREERPPAVASPAAEPAKAAQPLRILVAEDNEFSAKLMQRLLARRGHAVSLVHDGRAALALLDAERFDLLLLDVHMPELDGFQVIQTLRQRELATGKHLPAIALTARSRKEDRELCLSAGMDDFLTKPVSTAALFAVIDRHLPNGAAVPAAESPAAHRDAAGELLDPAAILAACGDDAQGLRRMCHDFETHAPVQLAEVVTALRDADALRLSKLAHKICPLLLAFSTVAGNAASDIEDLAGAGQLEAARPLVDRLETLIGQLLPQVGGLSLENLRSQVALATGHQRKDSSRTDAGPGSI